MPKLSKIYTVPLIRTEQGCEDTMHFFFEKPEGFTYTAGQFASWRLPDLEPTDGKPNKRDLSFSSAPSDPELEIAVRMRPSDFKNRLRELQPGDTIEMDAPHGHMILQPNPDMPAVFLAGGIGITPFRSILREQVHAGSNRDIILFYSNRYPSCTAFMDELDGYARSNRNVAVHHTMTNLEDKPTDTWTGPTGFIDFAKLTEALGGRPLPVAHYSIAGPPAMVLAMRQLLLDHDVPKEQIEFELYTGYAKE